MGTFFGGDADLITLGIHKVIEIVFRVDILRGIVMEILRGFVTGAWDGINGGVGRFFWWVMHIFYGYADRIILRLDNILRVVIMSSLRLLWQDS